MAKQKVRFYCTECGLEAARWLGQCPGCQGWNTLVEEIIAPTVKSQPAGKYPRNEPVSLNAITADEQDRLKCGIGELDRVLGGGLVNGSVILLGGEPGIGKSTLLLQAFAQISLLNQRTLYVSGEESPQQVKIRATRLNLSAEKVLFLAETDVAQIEKQIEKHKPALVCVDSVQTLYDSSVSSAPGSVNQVRSVTARLLYQAKHLGIPLILVGHVTKGGVIAGPRVLEHMVDTVLYFEGDNTHSYRILRAAKNRFGSTNEIGVFSMEVTGLVEVKNPSRLFLSENKNRKSGSVVVPTLPGSRPFLAELQALVSPTNYVNAQRVLIGPDAKRVALVMAVLEKKAEISFAGQDIFINLAGGLRSDEPAIDLGLALALVSSFREIPLDNDLIVGGEIGLAGELRAVSQIEKRLTEAVKLGFKRAVIPQTNAKKIKHLDGLEITPVKTLNEAIEVILEGGR